MMSLTLPDSSFILFKSRETAVLSSACSILLTHWYTSTVILDLTAVRLLWSICFAFTATAFVVTNVNVTICLGCLVWLYVVGTMGLLKPESHYFLIDFWVASSAIVIGFSESSVRFYLCSFGSLDLVTSPVRQVHVESEHPSERCYIIYMHVPIDRYLHFGNALRFMVTYLLVDAVDGIHILSHSTCKSQPIHIGRLSRRIVYCIDLCHGHSVCSISYVYDVALGERMGYSLLSVYFPGIHCLFCFKFHY
jgi:hypothetical protein